MSEESVQYCMGHFLLCRSEPLAGNHPSGLRLETILWAHAENHPLAPRLETTLLYLIQSRKAAT